MPDDLIAVGCGRCPWCVMASQVPDFCGGCGARFDRGDPVVVVSARLETNLDGMAFGVCVSVAPSVEYRGAWSPEAREASTAAVLRLVRDGPR